MISAKFMHSWYNWFMAVHYIPPPPPPPVRPQAIQSAVHSVRVLDGRLGPQEPDPIPPKKPPRDSSSSEDSSSDEGEMQAVVATGYRSYILAANTREAMERGEIERKAEPGLQKDLLDERARTRAQARAQRQLVEEVRNFD